MNKAARLVSVSKKPQRRIIGLMSGMSADGVDLACVDIAGQFPNLSVDIVGTHFVPYAPKLISSLKAVQSATVEGVSSLNVWVAEAFVACVDDFLLLRPELRGTIDAIGSHGQTLYHSTEPNAVTKSSLQVGSPSIIAQRTGLLTIGNFRARDISAGGTGAPLVSLADYLLFHRRDEVVVLNNLGSISNLTVVTPKVDDLLAFDTGPANMALDYFAQMLPAEAQGIDLDGRYSAVGKIIRPLLSAMLNNPFFAEAPPKAAGYKEFGAEHLSALTAPFKGAKVNDLLRTGVEFAAVTIAGAYRNFVLPRFGQVQRSIFSGGGVHNQTLMKRIAELLPELTIETLSAPLCDAKEAVAFAILANETLSGRPGSLHSVTGLRQPEVLGEIAL